MNIRELINEAKERCPQCGMTNCTCAPGTCKCKPVAGWIPNKGFKEQGVAEERTETKNEKGEVTSWKDEGEWKKSTANKDGRGKVTNLSDKARRETEKLSKKGKNVAEGVRDLGYDAQSLITKLRRDVEEKRLQPTPQAVLAAARELAGDMDFAPQLLVKQVLGQGMAEDHEIQMADSELKSIYQNSRKLLRLIKHYSEQDGLEAWQQSKITKAADYLNSVLQAVSGQQTR